MQDEHIEYYKDGSVKGKGMIVDSKMDGYWESVTPGENRELATAGSPTDQPGSRPASAAG